MAYPACPHCEHQFDDEEIWYQGGRCNFPTEHDGDEEDFDCPGCGLELHAVLVMTPSWQQPVNPI